MGFPGYYHRDPLYTSCRKSEYQQGEEPRLAPFHFSVNIKRKAKFPAGESIMPDKERRNEERYPPSTDTFCSLVSPVVEDFGTAKIMNISREGIGLLLT